ncbi:amidase [Metabacillus sp. HB246100]
MKKRSFISILIFLLLTSQLGVFGMSNKAQAGETTSISTWLWDTQKIVSEPDATLQFLVDKQVSHVYLQINRTIKLDVYKTFIRKASEKNVRVYALDGAPHWGPSTKAFTLFLEWVKSYQAGAKSSEKFSGIHLDIEPYLTSQWTTTYNAAVKKYQDALLVAKNTAASLNVSFAVDIPFWFDEMTFRNSHGKGNLAQWAIQQTDEVTIMAYRDKALGANGIIELVKNEMTYAQASKKKITLAVETMNLGQDGFLTFFEEGQAAMNKQLDLVSAKYSSYSSFHGFAVHHVGSWMTLKK